LSKHQLVQSSTYVQTYEHEVNHPTFTKADCQVTFTLMLLNQLTTVK